jgi:hypothetical protein
MRAAFYLTLAFTLVVCGGRPSSQPSGAPHGGDGDAMMSTSPGTGMDGGDSDATGSASPAPGDLPIDASDLPTAFVMDCGDSAPPIAFKLPCLITPGIEDDTVCFALGDVSPASHPVLLFWEPLRYLAAHRNEPIDLDRTPAPPPSYYDTPLSSGGAVYLPTRMGTLTVSQVDTQAGAYFGRLKGTEFTGKADGGGTIVCTSSGAAFWAVSSTHVAP